tara:strand:+ start:178 stop:888 length:711 start_codon:yes stop_codon:yes gene_type:complete
MINKTKWVNTLPKLNNIDDETLQLDHEKWVSTISKKQHNNSFTKYSILGVIFVFGLLLISALKNETRNLQKEINHLVDKNKDIKFNLRQAALDNEVITSPENISKLAKEYLGDEFVHYKKSQIKNINEIGIQSKIMNKEILNKENNKIAKIIKSETEKTIKNKKAELKKLKEIYSDPKSIPKEMRVAVAKKIKKRKNDLKSLYDSPSDMITYDRIARWSVVQVVKLFLGMPIVPGR